MKTKIFFLRKLAGSTKIFILVAVLGVSSIFIIIVGLALMSGLTGNNSGGGTIASLSSCSNNRLSINQKSRIDSNKPIYQAAADKVDVPWQFLASLHLRESNLSNTPLNNPEDGPFQVQGAKYKTFGVDSATEAGEKAKSLVKSFYNKDLSKTSNEDTIKLAFLAYNRGGMYVEGGCSWNQSPYVMNQFDAQHTNMVWPNNTCEPESVRGKTNTQLGTFTVYSVLVGCSLSGKTALPINPSILSSYPYNSSFHGRSVSYSPSKPGHNVILCPNSYNTNISCNKSGEAVDLQAPGGTEIYAPFDSKVVFSSRPSSLCGGICGGFIVLQSLDGQSTAALAHLQNYTSQGDIVSAGQRIGELKQYSGAFGPHLHFELWTNNQPIHAGIGAPNEIIPNIWTAQKKALGF